MELKNISESEQGLVKTIDKERKKGNVIYTVLRSVSRSGMMRKIDVYLFVDNEPLYLNHLISELGLYKRDKQTGNLKVDGCGRDMGFDVVYNLSSTLYPKGFKIKEGERNRNAINGAKPTDKGYNWDSDGGYALTQRWL